jgi:hypothetical protein
LLLVWVNFSVRLTIGNVFVKFTIFVVFALRIVILALIVFSMLAILQVSDIGLELLEQD